MATTYETQAEKTARHIRGLSKEGFLSFPNATANGEVIILSQGRVRMGAGIHDVGAGELLGESKLRADYTTDLQETKRSMATQGFLKPGKENMIMYRDEGKEHGQSMYATGQGKGGESPGDTYGSGSGIRDE